FRIPPYDHVDRVERADVVIEVRRRRDHRRGRIRRLAARKRDRQHGDCDEVTSHRRHSSCVAKSNELHAPSPSLALVRGRPHRVWPIMLTLANYGPRIKNTSYSTVHAILMTVGYSDRTASPHEARIRVSRQYWPDFCSLHHDCRGGRIPRRKWNECHRL